MNNQNTLTAKEIILLRKLLYGGVLPSSLQVDDPVLLSTVTLSVGVPSQTYSVGGLDGLDPAGPTRVGTMTNIRDPSDLYDATHKDYVDTLVAENALGIGFNFQSVSQLALQNPTALDTPLRVGFGPEILSGDITLIKNNVADPEGNEITFNTPGIYEGYVQLSMGRVGNSGVAVLMVQSEYDSVYQPTKIIQDAFSTAIIRTHRITFPPFEVLGGEVLTLWLSRLSFAGGTNDGGLFQADVTGSIPAFAINPCAAANFVKLQ